MPVQVSYPGVYVEEKPSGARTVTGVSTASTAFIDFFARGPMNKAVQITNFRDFERIFGGLHRDSEASYALMQYFVNGGSMAWVVRMADVSAKEASLSVKVIPNRQRTQDLANQAAQDAGDAAVRADAAAAEAQTATGPELAEKVNEVAAQTQIAGDRTAEAGSAADRAGKLLAGAAPNAVPVDPSLEADAKKKANEAQAAADVAKQKADAAKAAATNALDAAGKLDGAGNAVKGVQASATEVQGVAKTVSDLAAGLPDSAKKVKEAATAAQTAADEAVKAAQALKSDGETKPVKDTAAQVAAAATGVKTAATSVKAEIDKGTDDGQKAAAQKALDAATAAETNANTAKASTDGLPDGVQVLVDAAAKAAREAADAATAATKAAQDAEESASKIPSAVAGPALTVRAANPGKWGNALRVTTSRPDPKNPLLFQLVVEEIRKVNNVERTVNVETYQNLSLDESHKRYAPSAVNEASNMIQLDYTYSPELEGAVPEEVTVKADKRLTGGADGGIPKPADIENALPLNETGPFDRIAPAIFNILCLPITDRMSEAERQSLLSNALTYCQTKRAFLLIDPPKDMDTVGKVTAWSQNYRSADKISGAVYFPRLFIPDPLNEYRPREVGPSGTVAGVYARTDVQRGVWKAPAGIEAGIRGATIKVKLTDTDSGNLNPLGINVLRSFPVYGDIVWGARTLAGADLIDSEWKYVPVRRLANFLEESLFKSLKWVVFEPNDERTWAQIRLQVGSFLAGLFAQGAFQGTTPDKAYFVACDSTTTTQTDINRGIVNVIIGYAPLKPAEFVILQFEQIAGQT
jgi:hypothetical protein